MVLEIMVVMEREIKVVEDREQLVEMLQLEIVLVEVVEVGILMEV